MDIICLKIIVITLSFVLLLGLIFTKKKTKYLIVVLDSESKSNLLKWWLNIINVPLLDFIKCHHMTVTYPTVLDNPLHRREVIMKVVGYNTNNFAQAVLVIPDIDVTNTNPHVTISSAKDVNPVYSNELLKNHIHRIEHGPVLRGRLVIIKS